MLDLSGGKLSGYIQANLVAYMRLFAGLPGMYMHDAETFWFISHKPAPGNCILRARWADDAQVEGKIDALFAQVGEHIERIDWMIFPGDQPAGLGRRLEARGMPGGPGGNWLWADLTAEVKAAEPEDFHIELVRDDAMLAAWVQISEEGFQEELGCFYDAYARHGYGPRASSLHYIAYQGDTPVTSGTLLDAGGWASIYDVSTPPEYRRQGFGAAITAALMREMRRRGYAETWIWSSNIARSVYKKLGFVDADFGVREHTWQNPHAEIQRTGDFAHIPHLKNRENSNYGHVSQTGE